MFTIIFIDLWITFSVKGAVCGSGEEILIRRERPSLTLDFFVPKKNKTKQTVFVVMTEQTSWLYPVRF